MYNETRIVNIQVVDKKPNPNLETIILNLTLTLMYPLTLNLTL